ncbi:MAG: AbrB/MazE/SpoVT family DNA-binding domain-containing protein [Thermoleophilia bacterium]
MAKTESHEHKFFGSATVGERGQIVIPAAARQELQINAGDKLLIFSGMHGSSLTVMKSEDVAAFVSRTMEKLTRMEALAREEKK